VSDSLKVRDNETLQGVGVKVLSSYSHRLLVRELLKALHKGRPPDPQRYGTEVIIPPNQPLRPLFRGRQLWCLGRRGLGGRRMRLRGRPINGRGAWSSCS